MNMKKNEMNSRSKQKPDDEIRENSTITQNSKRAHVLHFVGARLFVGTPDQGGPPFGGVYFKGGRQSGFLSGT